MVKGSVQCGHSHSKVSPYLKNLKMIKQPPSRHVALDTWRQIVKHLEATRRRDGHLRVGYCKQDALRILKLFLDTASFTQRSAGAGDDHSPR